MSERISRCAFFTGQRGVVNGLSDLMVEDSAMPPGTPVSAVGVVALPLRAPVEVEAIVEVR